MRSDTSGCVWKRADAFGSIRHISRFFREFVKVFSNLGSFRSFRDVFRPVRACSDGSDASGSVRTVAFVPYTGEAPGAENLQNPRNVGSQGLT